MENEKVSEAVFVRVEDWEGLYIDGGLVDQNHTIDLQDSLNGKTVSFKSLPYSETLDEYVMEEGGFPQSYDELLAVK